MDSSAALVERVKGGDYGAFELLVKLYQRNVYNLAFRYMREHGAADDVVQEAFMKAFKSIHSFRGDASFKSWLLRITSNTALNHIRSSKKMRHESLEEEYQGGEEHKGFLHSENSQSLEIMKAAIAQLPAKQKMALELRVFEDLSFKEVAAVMECPFDTAKANYRHALMKLKKILKDRRLDLTGSDYEQ